MDVQIFIVYLENLTGAFSIAGAFLVPESFEYFKYPPYGICYMRRKYANNHGQQQLRPYRLVPLNRKLLIPPLQYRKPLGQPNVHVKVNYKYQHGSIEESDKKDNESRGNQLFSHIVSLLEFDQSEKDHFENNVDELDTEHNDP